MQGQGQRIGILSGGGSLPLEIADSARARGHQVHIVAIGGEADADFGTHKVTTVNWGQIGAMVRTLKAHRTDALVIVGRVHRPDLWRLRTDLGFFLNLPSLLKIVASGGDDGVLRRVVRFFEAQKLTVVGPGDAAPELVIREGALGEVAPSPDDAADIATGFALVRALGAYDIGQSVIVAGGVIEAIEGAEGTDRMLERTAAARKDAPGLRRGVMIKRSKPSQDMRVDMPTIGPDTITRAAAAGLDGIAAEAGKVLIAQRAEAILKADAAMIFIAGVGDETFASEPQQATPAKPATAFRRIGRVDPSSHVLHDASRGAAVLQSLRPFASIGNAVVVVRNHVLAVEAGEGALATLERAANLKQWASLTHSRRGIVILAHARDLTAALIARIDRAGYAGAVVMDVAESAPDLRDVIAAADKSGVCVLSTAERAGENA
jgi:DUF1009 family protein